MVWIPAVILKAIKGLLMLSLCALIECLGGGRGGDWFAWTIKMAKHLPMKPWLFERFGAVQLGHIKQSTDEYIPLFQLRDLEVK